MAQPNDLNHDVDQHRKWKTKNIFQEVSKYLTSANHVLLIEWLVYGDSGRARIQELSS